MPQGRCWRELHGGARVTRLTTCPDAETVAQRAAAHIERQLLQAREARGVAHLALSGGTTPGRCYELLGADAKDLDDVEVWFADERCVGPHDEQSNYKLVAETLLERAQIPPERCTAWSASSARETALAATRRSWLAIWLPAQPSRQGHRCST